MIENAKSEFHLTLFKLILILAKILNQQKKSTRKEKKTKQNILDLLWWGFINIRAKKKKTKESHEFELKKATKFTFICR